MISEFWLRFLVLLALAIPFGLWLRTRDFQKWERRFLEFVFMLAVFVLFDALRGNLS
ncbi:hypothetical protein ACFSC4_18110 [Deinococcus malanensis]|uniref:hypothetical protein n=1 Tax=Deinococcus malanensis TaxID=1706855 RepID=UPI00166CB8B2|nr:hypothetical protein [Deinococcus malanensis]